MSRRPVSWSFEGSYRALSYSFRVRTNEDGIGEHLDRLLATFRARTPRTAPTYSIVRNGDSESPYAVYRGRRNVHRGSSFAGPIDYVLWDVSSSAIQRTSHFLALHAGAVSHTGRGILLPGPPDSGKTTLTAALTRSGCSYLTDEAALLDPGTGLLHPFPRALWMEAPSLDVISGLRSTLHADFRAIERGQYHIHPDDLRPDAIGFPSPVGFVIAPTYSRGARTALVPMSRAEAVVMLADNSFNFEYFKARGVSALAAALGDAHCYRLQMGDLDSAVASVLSVVGGGL
jgi:hypothetical protein